MLQELNLSSEDEKIECAKKILFDLGFGIDPEWGCFEKRFDYRGWRYRITFGFSLYDGTADDSNVGKFWFWGKSYGNKIGPGETAPAQEEIKPDEQKAVSEEARLYNTYGIEPVKKTKFDRYSHLALRCGREKEFAKVIDELKAIFEKMNEPWEPEPKTAKRHYKKSGPEKQKTVENIEGQLSLSEMEV